MNEIDIKDMSEDDIKYCFESMEADAWLATIEAHDLLLMG